MLVAGWHTVPFAGWEFWRVIGPTVARYLQMLFNDSMYTKPQCESQYAEAL